MCRVLLIDDDTGVIESVGLILRLEGHEVVAAQTARAAIQAAKDFEADVALIDLKLGAASSMNGIGVLRELRTLSPSTACIIVTGFAEVDSAVEAMKLGAKDVVRKPIFDGEIVALVESVRTTKPTSNHSLLALRPAVAHSLSRWADVVVRAISALEDPRTLSEWGHEIGASEGAIRNWCDGPKLHARESLLLARVLRAVIRQQGTSAAPEHLLNIVDPRTLKKVLLRSGGTKERLPASVDDLLKNQRFIEKPEAIAVLRSVVAERGHR
jgi:FixJ family two-component response regulator